MGGTAPTDRAAFERGVLIHLPAAYNLAFLLLRSRADAEDAVQDASVRAYRSFHQMKGASAKPWLMAIVRNVCYRRLQERKRAVANVISLDEALLSSSSLEEHVFAQPLRSPEESAALSSDQSVLNSAIQDLPPIYREIIILRELEELSYNEIADVIGSPVGTVMSRLARARETLREAMIRRVKEDKNNAV